MENRSLKNATCYGCLIYSDEEKILETYNVTDEALKAVFQMDSLTLCFSCYERAKQAESFIKDVQKNQIELHKLYKNARKSSKSQSQSRNKLTEEHLQTIVTELIEYESNTQESSFIYDNENLTESEEVKVKWELEEEKDELLHDFNHGYVADDTTDLSQLVKKEEDEDDYPLKALKEGLEIAGILNNCLKKSTKNGKIKRKSKIKNAIKSKDETGVRIKIIPISRKQCMEERVKMAADENYLNSEYKCTDCLKVFTFKTAYEIHMAKHDPSAGDFKCDICKQRYNTEDKLRRHKKYHSFRYRCLECNLVRNALVTIKEHYTTAHRNDSLFSCPLCSKIFNSKRKLRRHKAYNHRPKERVQCDHCRKLFSTKKSLAIHIMGKHSSGPSVNKRHVCQECGEAFSTPSRLKYHAPKHTDTRDFYCVECDKSFKTINILQHHLRTALPHVSLIELRYPCQYCEKRFAIKRDVDRHMNRVHLNVKPYQCDQCEKAYVNAWSLTDHKRLIHEGYKRPRKYPCTMCDRVFDRNHILKSHMRTHTGERPYQCSECPAQFTQAGVLRTHVKLIHLKLTRDGRPKGPSGRSRACI